MAKFSVFNDKLYIAFECLFIKIGDLLVPLTSCGPWQSHLGLEVPQAGQKQRLLMHLGSLQGLQASFLMLAGFRNRRRRARAGAQNQNRFFHRYWGLAQGAQEGSRCSGSSVFTLAPSGKHCRLLALFWSDLGSQKLKLYSRWAFLGSIVGGKVGVSFCG